MLHKNKGKLILNSYPGVYELKCSWGWVCNGETRNKIISRLINSNKRSSKRSLTKPTKEYHRHFDWLHPYCRKVRESLEIDMTVVRCGQDKVLNRDNRSFVKTNAWKGLLIKVKALHWNLTSLYTKRQFYVVLWLVWKRFQPVWQKYHVVNNVLLANFNV